MSVCDIIVTMKIKGLIFKTEYWKKIFFLRYCYFGIKNRLAIKKKNEIGFKYLKMHINQT